MQVWSIGRSVVAVLMSCCFFFGGGEVARASDLAEWSCHMDVPDFEPIAGESFQATAACVDGAAPSLATSYTATVQISQAEGGPDSCGQDSDTWTAHGTLTVSAGDGDHVDQITLSAEPTLSVGTVALGSGPAGAFHTDGTPSHRLDLCFDGRGLSLAFTSPATGIAVIQGKATALGDCVFAVDLLATAGGAASLTEEGFDPGTCVMTASADTASGAEVAEAQPSARPSLDTLPGVPDELADVAPDVAQKVNVLVGGGDYPKADLRLDTEVLQGNQLAVDNRQYIHFWYDQVCVHNSKSGLQASWNDTYDTYRDWYNNDYPNPDGTSGGKACPRIESKTHSKWQYKPCGIGTEDATFDDNWLEGFPDGSAQGHVQWTLHGTWGCQYWGWKVKLLLNSI